MANSDRLFKERTDLGWTTGKSTFDSQHSQALIKYIQDARSSKAKRAGREADHSPPSSKSVPLEARGAQRVPGC